MSSLQTRKFKGDVLRQLRLDKKMSQGQLGSKISAHVTSISDWERGANAPSGRHVASLAREFDVSADHFYGASEEDDEESDPVADLMSAIRALVRAEVRSAA